jgi:hypothetical protein
MHQTFFHPKDRKHLVLKNVIFGSMPNFYVAKDVVAIIKNNGLTFSLKSAVSVNRFASKLSKP